MRSEPHSFQVSMDSPRAKNKPLKYFHSAFSPLPSAIDLRCSNNFKRKKQYLNLTTEYTHTCVRAHTLNNIIVPPRHFLHLFPVISHSCPSANRPLLSQWKSCMVEVTDSLHFQRWGDGGPGGRSSSVAVLRLQPTG